MTAAALHAAAPGCFALPLRPSSTRPGIRYKNARRALPPTRCASLGRRRTTPPPPARETTGDRAARRRGLEVSAVEEASAETEPRAKELVRKILEEIEGTDGGADIRPEKREMVDAMLEELEELGKTQTPRPMDNPLLFGNYEVSYVSAGRKQDGAPAGGNFREGIGKAIFHTRGVYQAVLQPDIAVNKVAFSLLGVIPGAVGLRGRVENYGEGRDTVKVLFERPCINFGKLHFRIGPVSDVVLTTTYLDETVRLGKGSLGSLFVFKRGGTADTADLDKMGLERSSPWALAAVVAALAALAASAVMLWQTQSVLGRVAAVGIAAFPLRHGVCAQARRAARARARRQHAVPAQGGRRGRCARL
eukprot:jgi/Tetstr1/431598/TSEL_021128.t1